MNHWRVICTLLALAVLLLAAPGLAQANGLSLPDQPQAPLGTGFIYQGYLTDGEGPADGAYDFQFSLYSVQDGGSPLGTLTLGDQAVTEGYFTVLLDFGAGMFDGSARWLAISVRGGAETGAYTPLDPRQALSAAPYAMYAAASPWAGLTGLPEGFDDDLDNDTTYTAGDGLTLTGNEFNVVFGGSGTAATASHSDHTHTTYWLTNGNAQTDPEVNFIGTTDAVTLTLRVNNAPVLRLVPNDTSPNLIGGYSANSVAAGVYAATIGGGGSSSFSNQVMDNYGVVGGGRGNTAGGSGSTVSGGGSNIAGGASSTVGGGISNTASSDYSTVGGGSSNTASSDYSTVGGGYNHYARGNFSTVGGGNFNIADGASSTVGGGSYNEAGGTYSTVPGGRYAAASQYGQMAYASGHFANPGDAQASLYVLRKTSTGTAWTELFLDGSSERISLANGQAVAFDILIVGSEDVGGQSAGYRIQGIIENIGGTTALVGTPIVTVLGENDAAWDVQVLADNTNDALSIQVRGATETIRWVANVQTAEVTWP